MAEKRMLKLKAAVLAAAILAGQAPAAYAASKSTRPVRVTATIPVMIEMASPAAELRTNHGNSLRAEWRTGRHGARLYTVTVR